MPITLPNAQAAAQWLRARACSALRSDSRALQAGDGFIAWPGQATDARRYVAAALQAGAVACLVEHEGAAAFNLPGDERVATLPGLKAASGEVAAIFHGRPGAALHMLAVTGTNGKSSTAWWTAQALTLLGRRCGLVGTLGIGEPGAVQSTGLTTPDPVTLQAALRAMVDAGFEACAIEASSIGIAEQRLAGTPVTVAQFTNFTRDHLDYHGDMAAYWACKRALFDTPGLRAAVINVDDEHGAVLALELQGRGLDVWKVSVATATAARLVAQNIRYVDGGLAFDVVERGVAQPLRSSLIGDYNASNLLVVLGGLRAAGVPLVDAVAVVPQLTPVPGRMQPVVLPAVAPGPLASDVTLPAVVVDYAHTPDALEKALAALQPMARQRGGRLWCVFGCGGDRDASKRPLMGAIAQRLADAVVLTSDNPRSEAPEAILAQIALGMAAAPATLPALTTPPTQSAPPAQAAAPVPPMPQMLLDRRAAIAWALQQAADHDVVLIAGKGHETVQEVAGAKLPFSDVDEALIGLRARAQRAAAAAHNTAAPATLMTLAQAASLLPGAVLVGDGATAIARVHSDSRSLRPGDLFVALRGERFDAHDFLPQARAAGAVAALAERGLAEAGLPGLQVTESGLALQQLAQAWRARFTLPVITVAGSNGKTTVTQMLAAILRAWCGGARGEGSLATAGNLNNHIGLPLTVLRLQPQHRAAVFELGMNHPGEIAVLARIAQPTVALVNNAQREHQEFMASVEAVAQENGAAIAALPDDGVAVFPADDAQAAVWRELAGARRCISFSAQQEAKPLADVTAQARWVSAGDSAGGPAAVATGATTTTTTTTTTPAHWALRLRTPAGAADVHLHLAGAHNLHNALAACAAALAAGAPLAAIVTGLQGFQAVAGRSALRTWQRAGRTQHASVALVDDSYNANPDSVRAAIALLAGLPGPHWLVLGDMGEVGDQGPAFHTEVGAFARTQGIERLWTAGPLGLSASQAFGAGASHFDTVEALIGTLREAPDCASALVKGSRFMRMERVVAALQAAPSHQPHQDASHAA